MQADEGAWSSDEPIDTEREFMQAMQDYKWRSGCMFPNQVRNPRGVAQPRV